jgi:hypothetical protein
MSVATAVREAMQALPRAENHRPGERVALPDVFMVTGHRAALDPERSLVIGNRGMGKSFWTHALVDTSVREQVASTFGFPVLRSTRVRFGFNGSERDDPVAPTPGVLAQAAVGRAPQDLWRAVLVRAVADSVGEVLPSSFAEVVDWVHANAERCARLLTHVDDTLHAKGERLLLLFDALERIASDWTETQERLRGLLQLALAAQSFRSLRLKVFLRADQDEDLRLFEFADGAKLRNTAVVLSWEASDLYALLFQRLRPNHAFQELEGMIGRGQHERLVAAAAGEFMGAGAKRGRVYTWLPTHLADARGQISPRTFLTAWREAAVATREGVTAVNHQGIQEGVRSASADRLSELAEDYPWVRPALSPLRGQAVPLERSRLDDLWRGGGAADRAAGTLDRPALAQLPGETAHDTLLRALRAIGVMEVRSNGKVNVPDIFRVEAGIKRRGGVKPPRRSE